MDGLAEYSVIFHVMAEVPWDVVKILALEEPWDTEFETALDVLDEETQEETMKKESIPYIYRPGQYTWPYGDISNYPAFQNRFFYPFGVQMP